MLHDRNKLKIMYKSFSNISCEPPKTSGNGASDMRSLQLNLPWYGFFKLINAPSPLQYALYVLLEFLVKDWMGVCLTRFVEQLHFLSKYINVNSSGLSVILLEVFCKRFTRVLI